nr:reverse transcriptase domain-containing protein [Tanacetum cinerariifolium]
MRTRSSSSNLVGESSPNPTTSNPKCRNRRRSKQPFILEESLVDTMADQRTMAELLRAPIEGYVEAIVAPPILAEHFELKHSLINMMTSDQFFGLEKDNPLDHIRWFNKLTSTMKYKDVPNSAIKLMLFPSLSHGSPFQKQFDESFHEAWDRYKDLLRACPHNGFTELHQLDTFYNALNPTYQDSLNSAAGGNLLERRTQDVLTIIENKSKKIKKMNEINIKAMQTQIKNVKNKLRNEMKTSIQASMSNQTHELKNMMASFFQINTASTSGSGPLPNNTIANPKGELKAITTRSVLVLDGPSIPMPPPFINLEEDERVEETLTNSKLGEFTIKVPPPIVQKAKPPSQRNYVVHQRDPLHPNIPYPLRMHKQKQQDKDEIQIPVILKKLPKKLKDPGKFPIPCGFSELKCKALADLGASINLMPLSVWKIPFIRIAHALINVHGEEMILRDGDERLTLNMRHDTSSYSNQPQKESINMINIYDDSYEDYLEDLFSYRFNFTGS